MIALAGDDLSEAGVTLAVLPLEEGADFSATEFSARTLRNAGAFNTELSFHAPINYQKGTNPPPSALFVAPHGDFITTLRAHPDQYGEF